ncbi:hypothetical protein LCGC14_0542500 [marine sediment metagenome]|uniref:Uncharacterized protein n=1 Tax=marine sediment metagenome TaxID=412755 RepID=A0A0F9RSI4_9ZZZZ
MTTPMTSGITPTPPLEAKQIVDERILQARSWIRRRCKLTTKKHNVYAYFQKHVLEAETGNYLTNFEFIHSAVAEGYTVTLENHNGGLDDAGLNMKLRGGGRILSRRSYQKDQDTTGV